MSSSELPDGRSGVLADPVHGRRAPGAAACIPTGSAAPACSRSAAAAGFCSPLRAARRRGPLWRRPRAGGGRCRPCRLLQRSRPRRRDRGLPGRPVRAGRRAQVRADPGQPAAFPDGTRGDRRSAADLELGWCRRPGAARSLRRRSGRAPDVGRARGHRAQRLRRSRCHQGSRTSPGPAGRGDCHAAGRSGAVEARADDPRGAPARGGSLDPPSMVAWPSARCSC